MSLITDFPTGNADMREGIKAGYRNIDGIARELDELQSSGLGLAGVILFALLDGKTVQIDGASYRLVEEDA